MRLVRALLAYAVSLVLVAGVALVMALVLAGPHADLLPPLLQTLVLVLCWLAVLLVPLVVTWRVWRRGAAGVDRSSGA